MIRPIDEIAIDTIAYNDVVIRCLEEPRDVDELRPAVLSVVPRADPVALFNRYVTLFRMYEQDSEACAYRDERKRRQRRNDR